MALEDATNPMQGVSGPGSFAKRTDLQYQPDQYGAGVEMTAQMQGAPLEKATPTPAATNTQVLFNDAGVIGGNANMTFTKAVGNLNVTGNIVASQDLFTNTGNIRLSVACNIASQSSTISIGSICHCTYYISSN